MIKCCLFTAPSPGFGGASPSPLGYQPSPSNTTPSPLGYSPMTPGGAPFTPGTGMDQSMADWHTTEIEVKIKETHDDHKLIHQTGIIRSVTVSRLYIVSGHSELFIHVSSTLILKQMLWFCC